MAKKSQAEVWQRGVQILARVIANRPVAIKDVGRTTGVSTDTIQLDIRELQALGIPSASSKTDAVLSPMNLETVWEGTDVGFRLHDSPSMKVKRRLGEATVDYLEECKEPIRSVVFGSGVTAYRTADNPLLREQELQVEEAFSSSALVLFAFAYYKPKIMVLRLAGGSWIA